MIVHRSSLGRAVRGRAAIALTGLSRHHYANIRDLHDIHCANGDHGLRPSDGGNTSHPDGTQTGCRGRGIGIRYANTRLHGCRRYRLTRATPMRRWRRAPIVRRPKNSNKVFQRHSSLHFFPRSLERVMSKRASTGVLKYS